MQYCLRMGQLYVRPLTVSDEDTMRRIQSEFADDDFDFCFLHGDSWAELVQKRADEAAGLNLPPDRVRAEFLVGIVDEEVVGRVSIRYELNEYLAEVGGHVGYGVRPQFRRRGYAVQLLKIALERLAHAGVHDVLVTCDESNLGSRHTIERCGGVYESSLPCLDEAEPKRRYWIRAGE